MFTYYVVCTSHKHRHRKGIDIVSFIYFMISKEKFTEKFKEYFSGNNTKVIEVNEETEELAYAKASSILDEIRKDSDEKLREQYRASKLN